MQEVGSTFPALRDTSPTLPKLPWGAVAILIATDSEPLEHKADPPERARAECSFQHGIYRKPTVLGRVHRMGGLGGLGAGGWGYRAVQSAGAEIPHPAAAAQQLLGRSQRFNRGNLSPG